MPSGPGNDRRGGDAGPPPGPSRADEDRDWGASKRNAPPPPPPGEASGSGFSRSDSFGRREEVEADRWARRGDASGVPAAAGERPRLQLKPRTGDAPAAPADAPSDGRGASVFGGAKPVAVRDVPDAPRVQPGPPPQGSRDTYAPRPPPPTGERPRLQLAPRSTEAPPAVAEGTRPSSVFGNARPREDTLAAQGKDPRVEDLKQFHTVDRAQTEEEKRLKDELEAAEAAAKADGADAEAQAKARDLALKLAKLTLELDDKVRFATAHAKENGHGPSSNGAAGPAAGKTDNKWRKADPASNGHAEA